MLEKGQMEVLVYKLCIGEVQGLCLEEEELGFIAKILRNKIKNFNLGIRISNNALCVFEILSKQNAGMAQILFIDTLKRINRERWDDIACEDLLKVFGTDLPDVFDEKYVLLWKSQKVKRTYFNAYDNLVDSEQYWREQLNLL